VKACIASHIIVSLHMNYKERYILLYTSCSTYEDIYYSIVYLQSYMFKPMLNQKWCNEWHEYGVSIMCDSWTDPTCMSVINFLLYSNGRLWFHSLIDATEKSRDAKFLLKVTTQCDLSLFCCIHRVTLNMNYCIAWYQ
jgi:hypothetical protein